MKYDTFLRKGYSHDICEDAIATSDKVIALSDGCSSSKDSHVGSFILANTMIYRNKSLTYRPEQVMEQLLEQSKNLFYNVRLENFDATILTLSESLEFQILGDGYLFIKYKDGKIRYIKFEYRDNTPFYISYIWDRKKDFERVKNNELIISEYTVYPKDSEYEIIVSSEMHESTDRSFSFWSFEEEKDQIECIGIASDGIDSFVDKNTQQSVPDSDIIEQILDFKSYNGDFLKRRMNKILKNFKSKNIDNFDDISIGAYYLG